MTKRKTELSAMNILMCMLVIFIHIASWTIGDMDKTSVKFIFLMVPWRLSAFVVQGFLFLSGVKLFASEKPFRYGKFLLGRVKGILLPYLLWVGIYYAYFIGIGWYTFSWCDLLEYVFLGTLCSHFYYIVIAMQFYLLLPLFRGRILREKPWLIVIESIIITALFKVFVHYPYDDRVFITYLCYFTVGAAVGQHYGAVKAWLKKRWWICGIAFVIFGFFDALLTYYSQTRGAVYRYFEVLHLGYCFSAIFFFLAFFVRTTEGRRLPRPIALLDRASYGIYLSHVLFIYIANNLLYRAGVTDMLHAFVLRGIFTYLVTLTLSAAYTLGKEWLHARKTARSV